MTTLSNDQIVGSSSNSTLMAPAQAGTEPSQAQEPKRCSEADAGRVAAAKPQLDLIEAAARIMDVVDAIGATYKATLDASTLAFSILLLQELREAQARGYLRGGRVFQHWQALHHND